MLPVLEYSGLLITPVNVVLYSSNLNVTSLLDNSFTVIVPAAIVISLDVLSLIVYKQYPFSKSAPEHVVTVPSCTLKYNVDRSFT